jgi:hypothetical protein
MMSARLCPPAFVRPPLVVPERPPISTTPGIAELDAKVITAGIDHLASAINASWFDLSPEAQARALELEESLSFLRRQLA